MTGFEEAFRLVVGVEGDYSDDPNDPGGKTRYGVTELVARAHGYKGPMTLLPLDFAKRVFRESYWQAVRADELPWPLALFVFDMAVNSGPVQAIRTLQRTLRVREDGVLGAVTLMAAQQMSTDQVALYLADRALFYAGLGGFARYGRGWLKRLFMLTGAV